MLVFLCILLAVSIAPIASAETVQCVRTPDIVCPPQRPEGAYAYEACDVDSNGCCNNKCVYEWAGWENWASASSTEVDTICSPDQCNDGERCLDKGILELTTTTVDVASVDISCSLTPRFECDQDDCTSDVQVGSLPDTRPLRLPAGLSRGRGRVDRAEEFT